MKVLHYLPRIVLEEGGVVRAVLDLCTLLGLAGHDVTVLTTDAADAPEDWKTGKTVKIETIGAPAKRPGFFDKGQMGRIGELIGESEFVHLHTPWELANRQLGAMAAKMGRRYGLSVHGMLDDWSMEQRGFKKKMYLALGGRRLLERAQWVHCTAEAERDQVRRWVGKSELVVAPLVFDIEPFADLPGPGPARAKFGQLAGDGPKLLFLSRVHEKKGIEVLIEAAGVLRERGKSPVVLIAGTGDEGYVESLKRLVTSSGLDDVVHFLGMVVGVEKVSLFEACDVFCLPTSQENFGLVLPESMACRTPVITTKGVDIWPEIQRSGAALIVDQTAEAFADAVESVLADKDELAAMGEKARAWVLKELDGAAIVRQYEGLYGEGHRP